MSNQTRTAALCATQLARWPAAEPQDLVKALYQAEFGCGHLLADPDRARQWLHQEMAEAPQPPEGMCLPLTEDLGPFSRVHLQPARQLGLSADTLFALFRLSASEKAGSMADFLLQLAQLEALVQQGALPLDAAAMDAYLRPYREDGCPPARHSEAFRAAYAPAYRIIRTAYVPFLPLLAAIDQRMARPGPVTVAIEGGSASGKSTLGALLQQVYGCTLFHMDDFFLQPHQRTPERYAQPGGNVDHERFLAEVLLPLRSRQPFSYRPFDCSVMALGQRVQVAPGRLCVVEGAYSMHPALAQAYDLSAFLQIDPQLQQQRILQRNGPEMYRRFRDEWIPLEQMYFRQLNVQDRCTLTIPVA